MLWPAFHFHSVLLIFVTLWPISTLCVADMVHAVADIVISRSDQVDVACRELLLAASTGSARQKYNLYPVFLPDPDDPGGDWNAGRGN